MTKPIDQLLKYPKEYIQGLSEFYPLTGALLTEYELVWDWRLVSRNTTIAWNDHLLEMFRTNYDWHELSGNGSIPFTAELLGQFDDRWRWYVLGGQKKIMNDPAMVKICLDHLTDREQENLFDRHVAPLTPESASWAYDFFSNYDKLNWSDFSTYDGFLWTAEFIREHADRFDWEELSNNKGIPWNAALIEEHAARWDWFHLCWNSSVKWDLDLITRFKDQVSWGALSYRDSKIKWTADMLTAFKDNLQWVSISMGPGAIDSIECFFNHRSIVWTPELFDACSSSIEAFCIQLAEDRKEDFEESNMELLEPDEHWTVFMNGGNWSEAFFWQMVRLSETTPDKKVISWGKIAHSFSQWDEWSKEAVALIVSKAPVKRLITNKTFPINDHPDIVGNLINLELTHTEWDDFSVREDFELPEALVEKHKDKKWWWISTNPTLSMSIKKKFEDQLHWDNVFKNIPFTPEVVEAFPHQWEKVKGWYKIFQPFRSKEEILGVLIPDKQVFGDMDREIPENLLLDFLSRLLDQPASYFKDDLEKSLRYDSLNHLVLNVQHAYYWPLLFRYADQICADSRSAFFIEQLGKKALQLLNERDFVQAIKLYQIILNTEIHSNERDLSIYCNALYAVQHDNSGLGVDAKLNKEFLKKCLPYADRNPAIYFNAACLYAEMNDLDNVYEHLRKASGRIFIGYEQMVKEINEGELFAAFRKDSRFESLHLRSS